MHWIMGSAAEGLGIIVESSYSKGRGVIIVYIIYTVYIVYIISQWYRVGEGIHIYT